MTGTIPMRGVFRGICDEGELSIDFHGEFISFPDKSRLKHGRKNIGVTTGALFVFTRPLPGDGAVDLPLSRIMIPVNSGFRPVSPGCKYGETP